jgi:hypothetical protein
MSDVQLWHGPANSLAAAEDPDSWPTTLDAALHPTLLGLYLLPPHRGPGAPPSNFARLAKTIELYEQTPVAAAGAAAPAAGIAAPPAAAGTIANLPLLPSILASAPLPLHLDPRPSSSRTLASASPWNTATTRSALALPRHPP